MNYIALSAVFSINGMIHLAAIESFLDDHPDSYWLVADVLNIEWRKGCLTTAGCAEPRFQETSHSFISHWISRSASDIALKCEVSGLDPTYGFPRICDTSPSKRIFDDDENNHLEHIRKQHSSNGKLIVEVRGKCFNASFALQKYDRCPTCVEHRSIAVVEQYTNPETSNDFFNRFNTNDQFLYAVVILSAFAVILTTGFACLLIAFLHQKHQLNVSISKRLLHSEPLNATHSLRLCEDDSRYDVPWEQVSTMHQRSPYRSLKTKNGFTPISPSLMGPIVDVMALARSDCRKTSPSSSFGAELHDSGLESV
ncbi:Protein R10E12.2 [Dirofilaria immitis]|nr:Protein R10E12.2 [Dirofilaria immitis]